ncbi:hypothetical protein FGO68_gene17649 [Halteria grandinella]|uniref:Uncharacterized protein n=1 Tax=Halteria grandinella TaxID=5974 RepID=A0A8J8P4C1_HALGN|nr:hypothetical protein FGO68_gene17649 [Halteria grandinella]
MYDNATRIVTFTPSIAPSEGSYLIYCSIHDTGIPSKSAYYSIPVQVQLYSDEGSPYLLILSPFVQNFTEKGQITIQMVYPFTQGLQLSDIKDIVVVHISPSQNSTDRDYTWYCESILESSLVVRVIFKDVLDLTDLDRLRINFNKNASGLYLNSINSAQLRVRMSKNFKIETQLPPQIQFEDNSNIYKISNSAGIGLKSVLYANFGMNLIMAASLQLLWGLINSLQLVVRTPLMGMKFPSHTKAFFSSFIMLTNFDILPSTNLNELVFGYDSAEYEENFSDLGYDSLNTVDNIGSFLYYLILILSIIILAKFTQLIGIQFSLQKLRARSEQILNTLVWNSVIRLCIETSLDLFISCLIRFKQVSQLLTNRANFQLSLPQFVNKQEQLIIDCKLRNAIRESRHEHCNRSGSPCRNRSELQYFHYYEQEMVKQALRIVSQSDLWITL